MTPAPRPWMPLLRHRFELGHTFVPRTRWLARSDEDGRPRFVSSTAALARRRFSLFRRAPSADELRFRLDLLAAEAEARIAELAEEDRGVGFR